MSRPKIFRALSSAAGLWVGVCLLGCYAGVSGIEEGLPDVSSLVTREVALKLTDKGHFALADVPEPGESEITKAQAEELAVFWAKDFIHLSKGLYEQEHGGRIDFQSLGCLRCGHRVGAKGGHGRTRVRSPRQCR